MNTETGTSHHSQASPSTQSPTFDARGNIQPRRTSKGTDSYLLAREPREDGGVDYHSHSLHDHHYEVAEDPDGFTAEGYPDNNRGQELRPQHYKPGTEWGVMKTKFAADGTRARQVHEAQVPSLRSFISGKPPPMVYMTCHKEDERASPLPSAGYPYSFGGFGGNPSMNNPFMENPHMNRSFRENSYMSNQSPNNPPPQQAFGDGTELSLADLFLLSRRLLGDEGDEGDEEGGY